MPDVRLAATGMDSCPASDEDTEDELESARRNNSATRTRLLPSTSRQLVRNGKHNFSTHIGSICLKKSSVLLLPSFLPKCTE